MSAQPSMSFYKMHSLGNDFMVLDGVTRHLDIKPEQIRSWSDRHTGVGFDQLLIIAPPTVGDADFKFQIYNADGSSAEQCGNGTRCVAMLARHIGLTKKERLAWQADAGLFETLILQDQVSTTMTVPQLHAPDIPFDPTHAQATDNPRQFALEADGTHYRVTPVSMGNPHGVIFLQDIFNADVTGIGRSLTSHPAFPAQANIGFCQVIDRQFVRLRVYERGVGETQACGSGACAAVVAASLNDLVNHKVKVSLPGGKLRISWSEINGPVTMTGPANLIYRGELSV